MKVFKNPVRIGNVSSYNMRNFSEFVNEKGNVKGILLRQKLVPFYNGEPVQQIEIQNKIGMSDARLRKRVIRHGLFHPHEGQQLIYLDDEIISELLHTELVEPLEKTQPCWSCLNYTTCAWARRSKPIEGWNAKPTVIEMNKDAVPSFEIENCPNYAEDLNIAELFRFDPSYGKAEKYKTNDSERMLWRSVIKRTLRDYANAIYAEQNETYNGRFTRTQRRSGYTGSPKTVKSECEEFLLSGMFDLILAALDITNFTGQDFIDVVRNEPDRFKYNFYRDVDEIYEV